MKRKLIMFAPVLALAAMLGGGPAHAAQLPTGILTLGPNVAAWDGSDGTTFLFVGTVVGANRPMDARLATNCNYLGATPYGYLADCTGVRNVYGTIGFSVNMGGGNDTAIVDHAAGLVSVSAGKGADTVTFKGSAGSVDAGPGADTINAKDGVKQTINCGDDNAIDAVYRDAFDNLNNCGKDIKL